MNSRDHHELWRDALNDATPDAFAEATLALTLAHARRVRRVRYAIRITAGATVAVVVGMFGLLLFRSPATLTSKENGTSIVAEVTESKGIPVRYLTDEELLARFPGQPVGLVRSGASCEFIAFTDTSSGVTNDDLMP